ncbi:MAG: 3'-5' exonuclease [Sphingobacteriia bacterium]|nr:3'-5' exonuclease [Sphingobacteriia bacterium]
MRTTFLDLETTGLDPIRDEILEIGILDDDGNILLDSLVRPERIQTWPAAQRINGIDPVAVANAPTLAALRPRLIEAVAGTRVVIYNASFDSGFLGTDLVGAAEVVCAMKAFAATFSDRRWRKLGAAAAHVGYVWPGNAHRAIHDCMATRAVWYWTNAQAAPIQTAPAAPRVHRHEC